MAPGFEWIRKITDDAALEDEILPGQPVIELVGEGRALVEGHQGVSAYSDTCVCVKMNNIVAEISGCNLKLTYIDSSKLVVTGLIVSVHFVRG